MDGAMNESITAKLTAKDDKYARAVADRIVSESRETDKWFAYFDEFAALLKHPKSYVRNRALWILAANAQWDTQNRFDTILPEYLSHITDDKPITVRQCVQALAELGEAKPQFIPQITQALLSADLSGYKDSMRPLLEKDIAETMRRLCNISAEDRKE